MINKHFKNSKNHFFPFTIFQQKTRQILIPVYELLLPLPRSSFLFRRGFGGSLPLVSQVLWQGSPFGSY
jgi:hypothetical protein